MSHVLHKTVLGLALIGLTAWGAPPAAGSPWPLEKQAVHVLNRLAYGPSPADLHWVERVGPSAWIEGQLHPQTINDAAVDQKLAAFRTLTEDTPTLEREYPPLKQLAKTLGVQLADEADRRAFRKQIAPEHQPAFLDQELAAARLVRAVESKRQLQEVLFDFWFNHFNVSAAKGPERWLLTSYERDAIRPHLFGHFRELLGAVAHHPAMLFYLDNWRSSRERAQGSTPPGSGALRPRNAGLNENYARELMELHTLGVDGGYTQQDVHEVARCFTGWSIDKPRQRGTFVFRRGTHDPEEKVVLGTRIPAGGGEQDGEAVLDLLARSPATARFLSRKLCQKFVSDRPSAALVDRVAKVYLDTDGDLTAVYRAIFTSPEFWSAAAFQTKTKTPLELAASSVRALGGEASPDVALARQVARLGEPLYRAEPPTGYPEIGTPWINAGALVGRINFGFALAAGRIAGTRVQLPEVTAGDPRQAVQELALSLLHTPLSQRTLKTVTAALAGPPDTAPADGERPPLDRARAVGLLLGSPEFQQQ
jgi:uncharacterized protein (DUF1800 family)